MSCIKLLNIHNYIKWEVINEGWTYPYSSKTIMANGYFIIQKRICIDCGYTETNIQRRNI